MVDNQITSKLDYFSNKKTIIQFILALFVFFIHFSVFSVFKDANGYLAVVFDILLSLTIVAVPLFFAISAALFYRNYTLKKTLTKWKSRFFSLCIPYMVWNAMWLVLALIGYYTPLGFLLGGVKTPLTFEAILGGIFLHSFFEPFWFILQLITLTALCPIIYLLLKNKVVGIVTIFACLILDAFGIGIECILIQSFDMVIVYLIGAYIGMHHFEWLTVRRSKKYAIIGLIVYIACCIFAGMESFLAQWIWVDYFSLAVTIIACIAFYTVFDFFDMKSCPRFTSESFLIYAMHSLIGAAISKIIYKILPSGNLFLSLNAIASFVLTVVIICLLGRLLERYMPKLKRILVGR